MIVINFISQKEANGELLLEDSSLYDSFDLGGVGGAGGSNEFVI